MQVGHCGLDGRLQRNGFAVELHILNTIDSTGGSVVATSREQGVCPRVTLKVYAIDDNSELMDSHSLCSNLEIVTSRLSHADSA